MVSSRNPPVATDVIIREVSSRRAFPSEDRILLTTLAGTSTFTTTKISLNPGVTLGEREKRIAQGYGKYTAFRDWRLDFVPKKASTYAGTVSCGIDYEAEDEAPATSTAMSTYQTFGSAPVRAAWSLPIRRALMFSGVQHKLIRCGPTSLSTSITDACAIMFATDGCDDTSNVLDVYLVHYINYSAAQTSPSSFIPNNLVRINLSAAQSLVKNVAEAVDFDETTVAGFSVTNSTGTYTIPCGAYSISGVITFSDSAAETSGNYVELYVNGVATTPPQQVAESITFTAGGYSAVPFNFYHSASDTFTLAIMVTSTGSAGTLALVADNTRIAIEALN
jgi:hypothetical protein